MTSKLKNLTKQITIAILIIAGIVLPIDAIAKVPVGVKVRNGDKPKGEFPIAPGQTIDESLSPADEQFDDDTYFDQYNLNWPGGDLTVTMDSSEFDEYLVVFEPPGEPDGTRHDVDAQVGTPPETLSLSNAPPGNYTIWANSFEPATGSYQISVGGCPIPDAPSNPSPSDNSTEIPTDVNLSWDAKSLSKVIYGSDDRMEVFEVEDPNLAQAADSIVVIVGLNDITDNENGTYTFSNQSFTDYVEESQGAQLCASEPYRLQPAPGSCTGFLVGPDLVVTAGHCMEGQGDCGSNAIVFGFDMVDANTPKLTVDSSEVYFCTEIVGRNFTDDGPDWAVIRLDRPVVGHTPLQIRREGQVSNNQDLVIIGHPVGLPKKVAGNANVRENNASSFFEANLDSYEGNSGAAVLNAQTLMVEGLLVRGERDFQLNGNCYESLRCPDDGCRGEDCTRTTEFDSLVPEMSTDTYTVFFGECGSLEELGTTNGTTWDLPELSNDQTYCWQIQITKMCGQSMMSPVWSFTTESSGPTPTPTNPGSTPVPTALDARADISGDGTIDADDLLILLDNWMRVIIGK